MANTTSGTVTFDKTFAIDEIIAEAYERIGSQVTSGYQLKSARRSLNILFQEWGNRGLHYREVGDTNIDLIEGQAEYTFFRSSADGTSSVTVGGTSGSSTFGVADILEATFRQNSTQTTQSDAAMTKIDRSTYSSLSGKLTKGTPSQYFVQRFIDKITITLYLTPGSSEAGKFINYYYVKRIQDAGDYTNDADVPYRFVPCMTAGLAYYLAIKNAPDRVQMLKMLYEDELQRALAEDGSSSSTYISPKVYYPES